MRLTVALFDCDGTLFAAQFGWGLLSYVNSHASRNRALSYYAALLPYYALRKAHLIDAETFNRPVIANLGRLIAGWDLDRGRQAFEWVLNEYLWPTRNEEVLKRLADHQAKDHRIVILSGILTPCLLLIGKQLGVTDIIGTEPEVHDGKYTGRIIPPIVTGREKLPALRKYFADAGEEVDWQSSSAYADSEYDHQVLEAFGKPVAVNPDPGLSALAEAKAWEVLAT